MKRENPTTLVQIDEVARLLGSRFAVGRVWLTSAHLAQGPVEPAKMACQVELYHRGAFPRGFRWLLLLR